MMLGPVLLLVACSDHELSHVEADPSTAPPDVEVSPLRLEFGAADEGEVLTQAFTVKNAGVTSLTVTEVRVAEGEMYALVEDPGAFLLLPGEERAVEVAFTPLDPDVNPGVATVASDDPDEPLVEVELAGQGLLPRLQVDPPSWDLGAHPAGCAGSQGLTFQNVGLAPLHVDAVRLDGAPTFTWEELPPLPWTLEPLEVVSARVAWAGDEPGVDEVAVVASSDDPRGEARSEGRAEALGAGEGEDVFVADVDPPVDILFAVDQSCSMDDDAEGLAANFATFVAAVDEVTTDWHVGVVTLDDGCLNGGTFDAASADLDTRFPEAVTLGDDLDVAYDEMLFYLVDQALAQSAPGGCNEGFRRADADLEVVVVSDEPERSTEVAALWTWDWWVTRLQGYAASPDRLRISGVVDVEGCGEGADGYAEAIAATGGVARSICADAWGADMEALGGVVATSAWSFPLEETPVPGTVTLAVDGAPWSDWSWDEGTNQVTVGGLAGGEVVEVRYTVVGECG